MVYENTICIVLLDNPIIANGLYSNTYFNQKYLFFAIRTDRSGNKCLIDEMTYSFSSTIFAGDNLQTPSIEDYLTMSSFLRTHKARYNKKTHKLIFTQ